MELTYTTPNIDAIIANKSEALHLKERFEETYVFPSLEEFTEYGVRVDLQAFLGLPKSFPCLFHPDEHPSAGILQKKGKYYYKCFSPKCPGKALTVFQVVQRIRDCSFQQAVSFLCRLLNCRIQEDRSCKAVKTILENNRNALADLKTKAPTAYAILKKDERLLLLLYDLIETLGIKRRSDANIIFSVSQRRLLKLYNERHGKSPLISRSLSVLAYLGFIEKIPLYETELIPLDALIEYSYPSLADGYRSRLTMQILLYHLDDERLHQIERAAEKWKANGYKKSDMRFQTIYEKEGIFAANKLFPQV